MTELTEEEIRQAQREYNRDYYHKNRKHIRQQQRKWRAENPDRVREYNKKFFAKQAMEHKEAEK